MGLRTQVVTGIVGALRKARDLLNPEPHGGDAEEEILAVDATGASEPGIDPPASLAHSVEPNVETPPSVAPIAAPIAGHATPPLVDAVIDVLHTVFDPEIPVDIYELGLIYEINVEGREVQVVMTLTSPNCPSAQALPEEVKQKVESLEGVDAAAVDIVWEPAWTPELMSEEARLELNM